MGRAQNQSQRISTHSRSASQQLRFLEDKFRKEVSSQPKWAELRHKLLALGGREVVSTYEEDMDALLVLGQVWDNPVHFIEGDMSRCHSNVARLYDENPETKIITGWALSDDGLWRQHTWGLKDNTVIETTLPRKAYYGFLLDDKASEEFVFSNG